jgi:hypothetical protein
MVKVTGWVAEEPTASEVKPKLTGGGPRVTVTGAELIAVL